MPHILYTIGYEGAEISEFLETLQACGIRRVIDIRDVPVSRKPGFSKKSLSAALERQGIGYTHLKSLGDPKAGRDAMRRGDYSAFVEIYNAHITLEPAQNALQVAVEMACEVDAALLCFERSPKDCHRTIVANEMCKHFDFEIRNLGVNKDALFSKRKTINIVDRVPAAL
jgi:uncharacterized protein (DUF488 family)